MKKTKPVFALTVLLAFACAPQFTLLRQAGAQERSGIGFPALDLRALGIDNEGRQIVSLIDTHAKFFKRADELKQKSILSPRDPARFREEADKRKADISTLQQQFQSLINKLKQGNHWDEAFDAQFLASLKNANDRSLLTQAGGARKLLEAGAAEFSGLRDDIDEAVRQVSSKQVGRLRGRVDRVFAAHAKPPLGKFGCAALLASYILATASGSESTISCAVALLYNRRGCKPEIITGAACH